MQNLRIFIALDSWPTLASESDIFVHVHGTRFHQALPSHIHLRYRRGHEPHKIEPFHLGPPTSEPMPELQPGRLCATMPRRPLPERSRQAKSAAVEERKLRVVPSHELQLHT